jgi:hypothetical protein
MLDEYIYLILDDSLKRYLKRSTQYCCFASILLFSPLLWAKWLEVEGLAAIQKENKAEAREQAIKNAMQEASFRMGFKFASQQKVVNGLMKEFSTTITGRNEARRIEIVSENVIKDNYQVIMRFEYDEKDLQESCTPSSIKSSLLIPQAIISNMHQLKEGYIYSLNSALIERLEYLIKANANLYFPLIAPKNTINIQPSLTDKSSYKFPNRVVEISNAQYLLHAIILDTSLSERTYYLNGLFSSTPQREFHVEFKLYHGISGEELWTQKYITSASWEFDLSANINPSSQSFWDSNYGAAIDKTLENAIYDLDQILGCRPTLGQVIARKSDRIVINLGRRHGVEVGQEYHVILLRHMFDRLSILRSLPEQSDASVTIQSVTEYYATATLKAETASLNVQVDDLVIRKKMDGHHMEALPSIKSSQ